MASNLARLRGESEGTYQWRLRHVNRALRESGQPPAGAAPPPVPSKRMAGVKIGHGVPADDGDDALASATCEHCGAPIDSRGIWIGAAANDDTPLDDESDAQELEDDAAVLGTITCASCERRFSARSSDGQSFGPRCPRCGVIASTRDLHLRGDQARRLADRRRAAHRTPPK